VHDVRKLKEDEEQQALLKEAAKRWGESDGTSVARMADGVLVGDSATALAASYSMRSIQVCLSLC
jgi:hypothetical protein